MTAAQIIPPEREQISAGEIDDFDRAVRRLTRFPDHRKWPAGDNGIHPYFGALLNAPPLADHISALGAYFRSDERTSSLTRADLEWADLVLAHTLHWNRVFYSHLRDAVQEGVRIEAAQALRDGRLGDLTSAELMLRDYVVAVQSGTLNPDELQELHDTFGTRGTVEYTTFVGYLLLNFRVMQAFQVPDRSDREVDDLLTSLRAEAAGKNSADRSS